MNLPTEIYTVESVRNIDRAAIDKALSVFANATAFLLAPHASEVSVEIGAIEEVLTDNAGMALHGSLWELDQAIALFAEDEPRLVATVMAYAEQLMERVALRAQTATSPPIRATPLPKPSPNTS